MTSKYCISSRRRGRQPLSDSKIFISAVYIPSLTIYRFLASKKAAHVRRAISDEAHEYTFPHPEREATFQQFAALCATLKLQRLHISASIPPSTLKRFFQTAYIPPNTRVVRASTDRPNLGYHFLPVHPTKSKVSVFEATKRLVHALATTLGGEEKIITFFKDHSTAELFSKDMRCPVYHSQLATIGNNTKGYNLWLWDSGQSNLISATTALIQGIDRPNVKYVVFHEGTYGLISYHQGGGRAGRTGSPASVFVVFNGAVQYIRVKPAADYQVRLLLPLKHFYLLTFSALVPPAYARPSRKCSILLSDITHSSYGRTSS
jgi:superfamily II DNA helicase RecQ